MVCECQNAVVDIVGVEHMEWSPGVFRVRKRDYSALAFRIRGTATITAGEQEYRVGVHDVLYLPQNCSYTADYSHTEIIVIHFRTARDDEGPQVFSVADTEGVGKAFLRAYALWNSKTSGRTAFVLSQLYDIFGQLCEQKAADDLPEHFMRAVSYINANFKDSGLCIPALCRQAGVSATWLRNCFERFYGKTPTGYITQLRLEHARGLISCGASVKQAALDSGFDDPKYFARVVKKHYHCTPRQLALFGK
ncbi:MAG: helix-turn-helix transcriptional regulator [Oscillospiraceae bacterium]|nr:helix-turn-helix transcriptional regulator [Oscillospiraceae bacterium]